ncbi:hypothetical protein MXZ28_03810 [Streptococcus uberis]|uniref:hypothetical protein n=1 Tax=Streptococcus uberis TaxID=1349 RepID=UPI001FF34B5F|nr:hypothetical protein [Streptococcus uberis]MCK1165217.1 hypothetical protein [Streptococcus uberis]MCK1251393.1 hypothetical protein [Streptococcus uberis]
MSKSSIFFNSLSVGPKKGPITVSTRNLVFDSIETSKIKAPKVDAKVEYSVHATKCYNIPNIEFSNCYPSSIEEGATHAHIVTAFQMLNNNVNIIKDGIKQIHHYGRNKERIETILKTYLNNDFDTFYGCYYKSDIITSSLLSNRGKFRVISLYIVEPKKDRRQRHSKHKLIVLFFDPYHLFIPSKDYGTSIYSEVSRYTSNHCNFLY